MPNIRRSMVCSVPLLLISAYDTPSFRENSVVDNSAFVKLLIVGDPNEAQITAARLRAAGIEVRLHGENFGPYPIPLGGTGRHRSLGSGRQGRRGDRSADWLGGS